MIRPFDTERGTTVIVADDDDDARSLVAEALRSDGYDVLEAADGIALLTMLDDPTLDARVVITDVKMPKLSGLGVLHALRLRRSVAVVVMTGLSDPSVRTLALQLGAVVVLKKPFEPNVMLAAVGNAKLAQSARNDQR